MNWTELLKCSVEESYKATDGLMAMVEDKDLAWKPATGKNWMTTGQLLMHLTNACGFLLPRLRHRRPGRAPVRREREGRPPRRDAAPGRSPAGRRQREGEARALLAADKKVALDMIAQAGEQKLANQMVAAPGIRPSARWGTSS
ncbi:MAG: DinB family protein [bacterium]|nr:DinB family protein [bacterium]